MAEGAATARARRHPARSLPPPCPWVHKQGARSWGLQGDLGAGPGCGGAAAAAAERGVCVGEGYRGPADAASEGRARCAALARLSRPLHPPPPSPPPPQLRGFSFLPARRGVGGGGGVVSATQLESARSLESAPLPAPHPPTLHVPQTRTQPHPAAALTPEQRDERHACHLDHLEAHARDITHSVPAATKPSNQHLVLWGRRACV